MTQLVAFALNHMTAPRLSLGAFFDLARSLGIGAVEIRNDIDGATLMDGTPPAEIRRVAEAAGLAIVSINALQRFDDWSETRAAEAAALAEVAKDCGAGAIVLVPTNDGGNLPEGALGRALAGLAPILAARRLIGLVEPLGFATSSLRRKSRAAAAIRAMGAEGEVFRLVHDTFHHHIAGEAETFAALTGLVHVSGVEDAALADAQMRDVHRVLVGRRDRLDNLGQLRALRAGGYTGLVSFEPFSPSVTGLADPTGAVRASMDFLEAELGRAAG